MRARFCGDFAAAKHAREFLEPIRCAELREVAADRMRASLLRNAIVRVGARRDLRQMRDAQDLPLGAELPEQTPDRRGDGAADPGIDLVKNQRRYRADLGEHCLDCQTEPRQLTA